MKIPPPNELQRLILTLDPETVLALNGYFEAAGEYKRLGDVAYIAVMAVVLNRAESRSWPDSVQKVVAQFRQFSWTNHDEKITDPQYGLALKFARAPGWGWDKAWLVAKDVARRVLAGAVPNPVQNATFYFNPHISNPPWVKGLRLVRNIGNHRFFAAPHDPEVLWACKRAEGEMMQPNDRLSKNFGRREFACRCGCGTDDISPRQVEALQLFRDLAGLPVTVISGCRCPAHNAAVEGEDDSKHLTWPDHPCEASDVDVPGLTLRKMYALALKVPAFKNGGIGIYPPTSKRIGFIHLDSRGKAARWGKVDGKTVSLEEALRHV